MVKPVEDLLPHIDVKSKVILFPAEQVFSPSRFWLEFGFGVPSLPCLGSTRTGLAEHAAQINVQHILAMDLL